MLFFSVKVQLSLMSFVGDFVLIEVICQKNSKLNEPYQVEFFKKGNTSENVYQTWKKNLQWFYLQSRVSEKKSDWRVTTYIRGLALKKVVQAGDCILKAVNYNYSTFLRLETNKCQKKRVSFIHSYLFYNPALDWT